MTRENLTDSATPPASPAADPMIGTVIDERYRVEGLLGEGGMGSVYVAEHLKLHKRVALKVIHPEFAGDGELAARFAREAMASAQLDHPHVASALDFGTLPEGSAYLVMELVRGESLSNLIEDGNALPWAQVCDVGAQIADALTAAHAAGIVHRDLKPDNVLLEPRDDGSLLAKVLDFGIARVMTEGKKAPAGAAPGKNLTRVGTVMGTPGYMAPEQAMGEEVDFRADLYALGVCLWELLVGRKLYDGHDLTAIVTQQLTVTPQDVVEASGDTAMPKDLGALVGALLSSKPADRPGSASVVRDLLRQHAIRASFTDMPAEGVDPTGRIPTTQGAAGTAPASGTAPAPGTAPTMLAAAEPQVPTKALALGCAGVGALALLVTIAAVAFGGDDDPAGPKSTEENPGLISELLSPSAPIPPAVIEHVEAMQSEERLRDRRRAARWLVGHEPASDVPDWARVTAKMIDTRVCEEKQEFLAELVDLDADEALPTVMRMYGAPRNQCGNMFSRRDCFGCMREDIESAVEDLGGDLDDPDED